MPIPHVLKSVVAIAALVSVCPGATIHVDRHAPPGGDGQSWETAYKSLHAALAAAQPDDEIWVAAENYAPAAANGDRTISFALPADVAVYGGFAGNETSRDDRDWEKNETFLSGDLNGDDGPDFERNDENSYHVLTAIGVSGVVLDGFTVRGGNANASGHGRGAGVFAEDASLAIRNCKFRRNAAPGLQRNEGGAGVFAGMSTLTVQSCRFELNFVAIDGAGVMAHHCDEVTIEGSAFEENDAAIGGGLQTEYVDALAVVDCAFVRNRANGASGGAFCYESTEATFDRCVFRENTAGDSGGLVIASDVVTVANCIFERNAGALTTGALGVSGDATIINCVFSGNRCGLFGGAVWAGESALMINCSIANNMPDAIRADGGFDIVNSVIWRNGEEPLGGAGSFTVTYSDVEGGWPGNGNIDADPLFVNPGEDNLRLSIGSPCLDAGSNDAVPPGVDEDLDGNPRILNGIVDMGAYEGEQVPEYPSDRERDVDRGEQVVLIPSGGPFDPENHTIIVFRNVSGPDDAEVVATEYPVDRYPGARGFTSIGVSPVLETTLEDGEFQAQIFIPFGEEDLGGVDPLDLDLTYHDEAVGNWALGVSRNTRDSPGHPRPVGDRIAREDGPWGATTALGDYGVYWNTYTRRGFVWANVDHATDFAAGVPICPADAFQPPDGIIGQRDIVYVLSAWGAGAGPFDVDGDGTVGALDVVAVLAAWGTCE